MGNNPPMPSTMYGITIERAENYAELKYQVQGLNDLYVV